MGAMIPGVVRVVNRRGQAQKKTRRHAFIWFRGDKWLEAGLEF